MVLDKSYKYKYDLKKRPRAAVLMVYEILFANEE